MTIAHEYGYQKDNGVDFPWHLNFRPGLTRPEAERIQQRIETKTRNPEVEPIQVSAEVIALDGLGSLTEQAAA